MKLITEVTRREIFDILINGFNYKVFENKPSTEKLNHLEEKTYEVKINYWGRLNEIDFLKRIYNLKELPSIYYPLKNIEYEIHRHTVINDDFELGWLFYDDRFKLVTGSEDKYLLNFLCEIFHPIVRDEKKEWKFLFDEINKLLLQDGYIIYPSSQISGRDVYSWKKIAIGEKIVIRQMDNIKFAFDTDYVDMQINLMYDSIDKSPNSAIGKAKELIETCCKTILDEQNIEHDLDWDLIRLMKKACKSIGLDPKLIGSEVKGQAIASRILGNLVNISQGMAELRNLYGDGHGKNKDFKSLPPRYAYLAVGSSVAAVHFMWDTYQERKKFK